jgi:hypothetical protein
MATVIIYPQDNGSIALVTPTGALPLADVAQKDVPAGVPYRYMEYEDLPESHVFFNAWEADFSAPDGYGIGADAYFAAKEANQ